MKKLPSLSIFFPFWNEEGSIEQVVTKAAEVAKTISHTWEILMIDDGSIDGTLEKANQLMKKDTHFRTISLSPNRGYGAALKAGFENAKYDYIVFTDGDLQFDFSEVTNFVEKIENYDMVIGYRIKRQDNFMRHILMILHRLWVFIFFRLYVKDIDCGFKMFRRKALLAIMPLRSEGAMITTEILAKAKAKNLTIAQVGVVHLPRQYGESSGGNFSVIVRAMLETLILAWDIRNKRF